MAPSGLNCVMLFPCDAWRAPKCMGSVAPGIWDLSSLIRDQAHIPCIPRLVLTHWTSGEVLVIVLESIVRGCITKNSMKRPGAEGSHCRQREPHPVRVAWRYVLQKLRRLVWLKRSQEKNGFESEYTVVSALFNEKSESSSVMSNSLRPHGLYSPWKSPGQNTGVGSLSLLQGIFPTQGSNPALSHCRWILYQLSHQRSPFQ